MGQRRGLARALAPIVAVAALLLAGCHGSGSASSGSPPAGLTLTGFHGTRYAAVDGGGRVAVADARNVYRFAATATGTQAPVGTAAAPGVVAALTTDLAGQGWWASGGTPAAGLRLVGLASGTAFAGQARLSGLLGLRTATPALAAGRTNRSVSAVGLADSATAYVATYSSGFSVNGDSADCVLWKVDAQGATLVAGRVSALAPAPSGSPVQRHATKPAPASALKPLASGPATGLDLERVVGVLPMSGQQTLLVVQGPAAPDADARSATFGLFRLDGGTIERLATPALADDGLPPLLSRIDATHALLTVGAPDSAVGQREWLDVDLTTHSARLLGHGPEQAVAGAGAMWLLQDHGTSDSALAVRRQALPH